MTTVQAQSTYGTPPKLIDGIVTDLGVYSPFDLKRYFDAGTMGEYEMIL